MINPPLRHILTLVCLAETRSFRRAAERLHLSQPAVSAHIRDLERHFSVPLVYRTTRHVSLTAEGEAFAARARRALQELEMASQDLRDLAAVHRGRVVVACIPPMLASVVPNVVRRIVKEFPAVEVEILDVLSGQVEQLVARGDADFGIGPRPVSADLSFSKLERDYFVAAMSRDHPLAGRDAIDLDELAAHPIVTMTRDANARQIFDRAIQRLRRPIKPRFELVHHFSVGRFVEAGLGVTVLPRTAIPSLASHKIVTVEIRSPRMFRDIGLVSRRKYQPSPSAQVFMNILKTQLARIAS
jgi:LysR family transcriptional regulator, carnitine catabolism transcriptional activator